MYRISALIVLAGCQAAPISPSNELGAASEVQATKSEAWQSALEERSKLVQVLGMAFGRAQQSEVEFYSLGYDNGEGVIGFAPAGVAMERLIRLGGGKPLPGSEIGECVFQEREYNRAGQILEVSRWGAFGGAGNDDFEYRHEFKRGVGGRIERVDHFYAMSTGAENVGVPPVVQAWTDYEYDEAGWLAARQGGGADDSELQLDQRVEFTRDRAGALVRIDLPEYLPMWPGYEPWEDIEAGHYAYVFGQDGQADQFQRLSDGGQVEVLGEVVLRAGGNYRDEMVHVAGRVVRMRTDRLGSEQQQLRSWSFDAGGVLLSMSSESYGELNGKLRTYDSTDFFDRGAFEHWPSYSRFDGAGRIVSGDLNSMTGDWQIHDGELAFVMIHEDSFYTYVDDEHGNWIERIEQRVRFKRSGTEAGVRESIQRELVYFDE